MRTINKRIKTLENHPNTKARPDFSALTFEEKKELRDLYRLCPEVGEKPNQRRDLSVLSQVHRQRISELRGKVS